MDKAYGIMKSMGSQVCKIQPWGRNKFRTHVVELSEYSENGDDYHHHTPSRRAAGSCGNIKPQRLSANIAKDYHTPTICIRNKRKMPVA